MRKRSQISGMKHAGKICCLGSDECRISNLHESAICHILSLLPTKDALRTSILSKDWRYKWIDSYNFYITDRYNRSCNQSNFVNLVDKVLTSGNLTTLRLKFYNYNDSTRMQSWISHAMRHKLEVFQVIFAGGITFPCSLLSSTYLRRLDLQFYHENILNVVPKNCAPNLTSLYLFKVRIVNMNPGTSTISFMFPVLETFSVKCCKWKNVKLVEVNAPRLLKFECSCGLPEQIILDGSSSVISAALHSATYRALSSTDGLQIQSLLKKFTSLKDLEISCHIVRVSQLSPSVHCFDKLRHLALTDQSTTKELFKLLHLTPSLKSLSMNAVDWGDRRCFDYGTMEHVPSCISQLEEIEFHRFDRFVLCNLAKFFMEKGDQLKRISVIRYSGSATPEEVHKILIKYPKSSPCLIIDIAAGEQH